MQICTGKLTLIFLLLFFWGGGGGGGGGEAEAMPVMCVSSSLIVCDNVQYIGLIMIHPMFSRLLVHSYNKCYVVRLIGLEVNTLSETTAT